MSQPEFSAAFNGSPVKRAKLRGRERNVAVGLGSLGTTKNVDVLRCALGDEQPPVREHAAEAIEPLRLSTE